MRQCIFCGVAIGAGREGNKAEEHAYPLWLQKRIGAHGKQILSFRSDLVTGEAVSWSHNLVKFVAKNVCDWCNEGWMNDLEQAVCPVFERLFQGVGIFQLSSDEHQILRKWMYKTTLAVVEAAPIHDKHSPLEHFRAMAFDQTVPDSIHVVAAHVGGHTSGFGMMAIGRLSVMRSEDSSLANLEGMGGSYIVVIHVANTIFAMVYCEAPIHVLGLDQDTQWPVGRSLDDYAWYLPRRGRHVRRFKTDEDYYQDFARSILIMAERPSADQDVVIRFGGFDYRFVDPPDWRRRIHPAIVPRS